MINGTAVRARKVKADFMLQDERKRRDKRRGMRRGIRQGMRLILPVNVAAVFKPSGYGQRNSPMFAPSFLPE